MLRLVTGPFHPTLETTLVDDLRSLKACDPLAGMALVVPSDELRRSLKRLLALTHGLSLLNVHIFTFHQLALHLDRERILNGRSSDRAASIDLVTDVFFEHLLHLLSQRDVPQTEALRLSQLAPGAWAALWASLRDLKDATVDPALALRAVDEKQFTTEDSEKLKGLFTLYAALRESRSALGVGSPDDLAALVTELVPASPFLGSLTRLCYYGSYDLTQTQLTLLEKLAATVAVTVYFPQAPHPAYEFARQFLERYLYPLAGGSENAGPACSADTRSSLDRKSNVSLEVLSAAGRDDELALVCKQILSLVETHGYRFGEIGVVGRTLVPYQSILRQTFDQHRIPFVSSANLPLLQEPAAKTLLHLAQLKGNGFSRPAMLDVLASPWNRGGRHNTEHIEPQPDLWRVAVRVLGITRGEEEWRRLARLSHVDASTPDGAAQFTEDIGGMSIDGGQLRLLWNAVSHLIHDVNGLPSEGGYGELTDAFLALAEKHLTIGLATTQSVDPMSQGNNAADVSEALSTVFVQLQSLDRLALDITWDQWTETFAQLLERTTSAVATASHDGVQVLDAMAARGLGFRALFMMGLNEKVFPRYIHEDGFLRDRHRLILSETLGYKIDQKLQGYAEEALLFELLRSSASDRLYISYQRADTAGRPLAPSSYLDTVGSLRGQPYPDAVFALPRRWPDRAGLALFASSLLTREELTVRAVLQGRDVSELMETVGRDGQLFSHGLAAQGAIESAQPSLNAFDGILEHSIADWPLLSRRGLSPTALECYARCPFQYFASQVLDLESIRQAPSMNLSPPAMGQLCHEALRHCYRALIGQGWPEALLPRDLIAEEVSRAVAQACAAYGTTHGTGYAVTWQLAQEQIHRIVSLTVALAREEALASGFLPVEIEIDAEGTLQYQADLDPVPIRGRWDRVDRHPGSRALRVIDYKYRANDLVEAKDRNLVQSALRGSRLQPALYTLMTARLPGQSQDSMPQQVDFLYLMPRATPGVERASFPASAWQGSAGPMLNETLQVLVEGVRDGRHVIVPDAYCARCDFSTVCRRTHQPSWWRAHRSSQAGLLRSLRSLKVPRD